MNPLLEIGLDAFRKSLDAEVAAFPEGRTPRAGGRPTKAMPNGEDYTWWAQNGPAYVQSWITWRQNNPDLHVMKMEDGSPAIELPVAVDIEVDGQVIQLKGVIDRVLVNAKKQDDALITDLKTGKTTPAPMQLAFYRRALKAAYGIDAKYGAYWMAREGSLSAIHDLTPFTDEMVDYWVAKTYAGIQAGIFLPHVTTMCRGCGVRTHCYVHNPTTHFPLPFTHTTVDSKEAVNV
jgi:hypothetical protein